MVTNKLAILFLINGFTTNLSSVEDSHNEHDYANLVFYEDEEHASPSHRFISPFVCNKHFILFD